MSDRPHHPIDPSLLDPELFSHSPQTIPQTQDELDEATAKAITASLTDTAPEPALPEYRTGQETDPTVSPGPSMAPFDKPNRDENTPHPLHLTFVNKAEFDIWFAGESSWCHYVQRRITTPEKRAEERLRAREKAYERALSGGCFSRMALPQSTRAHTHPAMTPEEAAAAAPLKKRRRLRTSTIQEKVTYTCHHAGKYTSQHSDTLPAEKLRMNTKKSVKCDCTSRIVLTELQHGDVRVAYYWKHVGHDPFDANEQETGRLPKVVDDWLIAQLHAGKDMEAIRKVLTMTDAAKALYLQAAIDDPGSISSDMPPPLIFNLRIKYPDIYNRYRKLKGPVKGPKAKGRGRKVVNGIEPVQEEANVVGAEEVELSAELQELATAGQADLARVLLDLPATNEEVAETEETLNEAVMRMANEVVGGIRDSEGDRKGKRKDHPETAWEAMQL